MEILAVIQHYTTWANLRHTKLQFQYINDINSYFNKYSNHPAILESQQFTNNNFTYEKQPSFVLYHSDPPEFKQIAPYSNDLIQYAHGEQNLIEFANLIRDFARDTDFKSFFDSHKSLYEQIQSTILSTIGGINAIEMLEAYYGEKKHSYNIIPTPLFHGGGYGPMVSTLEGQDIYNICGPQSLIANSLSFGTQEPLLHILFHEFSHSFVNHLTAQYYSEIYKSSALFIPIKDIMERTSYGNWYVCVVEHLVRANRARFLGKLSGNAAKELYLQSEILNGFYYIREIEYLMQTYENKRDKYPTYESFFPEIINLLNSLIQ